MQIYDHSVELSIYFYHQTLYVYFAFEVDGSTKIVSRNETVDRVSTFMSRFQNRHSFLHETWGCRANSSIYGFHDFCCKGKKKMTSCNSMEDLRRKVRRVEYCVHTFVNDGECHVTRGGVEDRCRVGDIYE